MEPENKSDAIQALVMAIYKISCLIDVGDIVAFGDKIRRRCAVVIGAHVILVGAAIKTSSFGLAQMIVGVGLGISWTKVLADYQ
ncbi:hypothetical protein PMIN04_000403 [Paraphaeosphaeria minitans]